MGGCLDYERIRSNQEGLVLDKPDFDLNLNLFILGFENSEGGDGMPDQVGYDSFFGDTSTQRC